MFIEHRGLPTEFPLLIAEKPIVPQAVCGSRARSWARPPPSKGLSRFDNAVDETIRSALRPRCRDRQDKSIARLCPISRANGACRDQSGAYENVDSRPQASHCVRQRQVTPQRELSPPATAGPSMAAITVSTVQASGTDGPAPSSAYASVGHRLSPQISTGRRMLRRLRSYGHAGALAPCRSDEMHRQASDASVGDGVANPGTFDSSRPRPRPAPNSSP